jgi:hypothetical protein
MSPHVARPRRLRLDRCGLRWALTAVSTLLAACDPGGQGPAAAPSFRFDERAAAEGLGDPLVCGVPDQKETILEVNGNGGAFVDLDGDGDLDLVLVDGSTKARWLAGDPVRHRVLLNQTGGPRFREVGVDAGLVMGGWPTGIASGDVDRDGRPDLVIGGLGEDALFLNRTTPAGVVRFEKHVLPGRRSPLDWTTSVGLADADGDGLLDLYLVRYLTIDPAHPPLGDVEGVPCRFAGHPVLCGPHGLPPQSDVYLAGRATAPFFEEATSSAGLSEAPAAFGLGLLFMDLDLDGDPDLYVANDSVDNFVFRNDGQGRFEERGAASGAASDMAGRAQAGMGVDAGDVDSDGDLDLVVTNFSQEANTLYRHDGGLLYRDVATAAGLAHASRALLGWGVHLADFDADGHLDLFFANGHVYPEADRDGTGTRYAQPCMLLPGDGRGAFGANAFPDDRPHRGRTALRGDVDGDGDLDLLVLRLDGPPLLYVNRTDAPEQQLLVTLRAAEGHAPDAYGATLLLHTTAGPLVRQKRSASAFQSQSDPRLHVALPAGARVERAEVLWPGGSRETLDPASLSPGRHLVLRQGEGVIESRPLEMPR